MHQLSITWHLAIWNSGDSSPKIKRSTIQRSRIDYFLSKDVSTDNPITRYNFIEFDEIVVESIAP